MSLTADEVRTVADLARLQLGADELAQMARQLAVILAYVEQLNQVETANVAPLAHPLPVQNIFREDTAAPSLPRDAALANAPARKGDFFAVPAVLD